MSINVAQAKLQQSLRELMVRWEEASDLWDDSVSRDFREKHLDPIEGRVQATMSAMSEMTELLARARRDCADHGGW